MRSIALLTLAIGLASAQETVLAVYMFHRHGDRTSKSTPPANLTGLGYQQVFDSGSYYRSRYVSTTADRRIHGINSDVVKQSQLSASAPSDTVLENSAQAFLQGLYPPVGSQLGSMRLRNGTTIELPLNGYQLIPVQQVSAGGNSENSPWLQGASNCANAQVSSNNYFTSSEYSTTLHATQALYNQTYQYVNETFTETQMSFKNAYAIWDLLNVASINNASARLPDDAEMFQLELLANQQQWGLAYNQSDTIRAVAGSVLAGEVLSALNASVTGASGSAKLNVQFGNYATMMSFFGLSNLTTEDSDFFGIPDYASCLTWELVTNTTVTSSNPPSPADVYVRFYFHNGTTTNASQPTEYSLFDSGLSPLPWDSFVSGMQKFAIDGQEQWCQACGNNTGTCSQAMLHPSSSSDSTTKSTSGGLSKAVCGVIGAMVTLGVILGLELLVMFLGGFRIVSKKSKRSDSPGSSVVGTGKTSA